MADGDSISGSLPTAASKFIALWPSPRTEELWSNLTDEQLDCKLENFLQGMNVFGRTERGSEFLGVFVNPEIHKLTWRYGPQRPLLTTFPRSASIIPYTCRCFLLGQCIWIRMSQSEFAGFVGSIALCMPFHANMQCCWLPDAGIFFPVRVCGRTSYSISFRSSSWRLPRITNQAVMEEQERQRRGAL